MDAVASRSAQRPDNLDYVALLGGTIWAGRITRKQRKPTPTWRGNTGRRLCPGGVGPGRVSGNGPAVDW